MRIIYKFMHMTAAARFVRLCFVVLFGTMSLMHGPVMAYSGHHAADIMPERRMTRMAARHHDHGDSTRPQRARILQLLRLLHGGRARQPIARVRCTAVLFGILRQVPTAQLDAVAARPDSAASPLPELIVAEITTRSRRLIRQRANNPLWRNTMKMKLAIGLMAGTLTLGSVASSRPDE